MNLRIIKGGIQDTVQDQGRYGFQHLGINPTGAMDRISAIQANLLVGNDPGAAVLELHFPVSEFFFEQPALISITGADFCPQVNGEEIECYRPVLLSKFSILQFTRIRKGARCYLAAQGGFGIPPWLNSCSTNLRAAAGGYRGRVLRKDDEIGITPHPRLSSLVGSREFLPLPWKADPVLFEEDVHEPVLVLPGHEWTQLDANSLELFYRQAYTITNQSDRMGYLLEGDMLSMGKTEEQVSAAVCFGTVQALPGGQLMILMADHQSTGGYPRLAQVISAQLPRLAQMNPGQELHFQKTDLATAHALMAGQRRQLLQLQHSCRMKLDNFLNG